MQVIAFLYSAMRSVDLGLRTVLIVTPVNVLHNWRQEFLKWRPLEFKQLRVYMLEDVPRFDNHFLILYLIIFYNVDRNHFVCYLPIIIVIFCFVGRMFAVKNLILLICTKFHMIDILLSQLLLVLLKLWIWQVMKLYSVEWRSLCGPLGHRFLENTSGECAQNPRLALP